MISQTHLRHTHRQRECHTDRERRGEILLEYFTEQRSGPGSGACSPPATGGAVYKFVVSAPSDVFQGKIQLVGAVAQQLQYAKPGVGFLQQITPGLSIKATVKKK